MGQPGETLACDRDAVRIVLDEARGLGRTFLTPSEAGRVCAAYAIELPASAVARSADEAVAIASEIGYPVVLKIASPDVLHKTEVGGVIVGVTTPDEVAAGYEQIVESTKSHVRNARIEGIEVHKMLVGGQEVMIGALEDPTFGPLISFGLGGVFVEVLRDVTFRLAPTTVAEAGAMLDSIAASDVLHGVRGGAPVDRAALCLMIARVSRLISDFPEINEIDLNPVLASEDGAIALDVRIILSFDQPADQPVRYETDEILAVMNRMLRPAAIAVVGASAEDGKIGNSVVKNLLDGGYEGKIYPVNPKASEILGLPVYASIADLPDGVDVAIFTIPGALVPAEIAAAGDKKIPAAVLIPSGFAETGNVELQRTLVETARASNVRFIGPNIYGFYYTADRICATFCTPYDVRGSVALVSQSGGIGMAILGFSRASKLGVSAIVGVGNKADVDEDDLLTFFEHDESTACIALHMEDLKDGRAFVDAARRVTKTKPIIVLKAGGSAAGSRAAASHTAALAGDDKVYGDILAEIGVVRAHGLREMLELARALPILPIPKGENVLIITGAGGSGVLLADACERGGLQLMAMPEDLDASFREFIPPFGASGNPVDITGGEPPSTYANTIALGLSDPRVHAIVLGYWHTIITPPSVFAELLVDVVEKHRLKGIEKPVVVSLAGDVEVETAAELLFEHGIPAYPYTTETPVEVLAAKYKWSRKVGRLETETRP